MFVCILATWRQNFLILDGVIYQLFSIAAKKRHSESFIQQSYHEVKRSQRHLLATIEKKLMEAPTKQKLTSEIVV